MTISLAATTFAKASVGTAALQKISLGTTMLWSSAVSFSDNFNRDSLGTDWTTKGFTDATVIPVLAGNRFCAGALAGTLTTFEQAATYTAASALTDNHAVRATISTEVSDGMAGLIVRSTSDLQNLVVVKLTYDSAHTGIWTRINGTNTRRTTSNTFSFDVGDVAEFRVSGNVYQLIRNPDSAATVVAAWTDSGNLFPASASRRHGGLWASSNSGFGGEPSAELDDFRFRDL